MVVDKMERMVFNGGRKLRGNISISGAKNAALPIMAASFLTKKEVALHNVPMARDIEMMAELVRCTGAKII
jgi:UDP-N-acetylglucosamine 1-carboxyvinyltransferase